MNILLSTAYLPPVEYMAAFYAGDVVLEQHENFIKQTYRNRAVVPSAEKILALSVPVNRNHVHNCPLQQVEIDYSQPWQREHWRTLETIYNASPFFLYYKDYLYPFYSQNNIQYLFDFNNQILKVLLKLFQIKAGYSYSDDYESNPLCALDLRNVIHPKKIHQPGYPFLFKDEYRQVFAERTAFVPNMSCVDLLFNEGPVSHAYLQN
ncbi:MAG: WbqC family protein, partial [Bacteroidales bacterium]|nr:WbqC family protein [Bacteroidales bacterium]